MSARPHRKDFIVAALRGDWTWVDSNLKDEEILPDDIHWATTKGLNDANDSIRDLAATYLNVSGMGLDEGAAAKVRTKMRSDPYQVVRHRCAVALWRRGYCDREVQDAFAVALADPEVEPTARKFQKAA